jgi:hypothetical protein
MGVAMGGYVLETVSTLVLFLARGILTSPPIVTGLKRYGDEFVLLNMCVLSHKLGSTLFIHIAWPAASIRMCGWLRTNIPLKQTCRQFGSSPNRDKAWEQLLKQFVLPHPPTLLYQP